MTGRSLMPVLKSTDVRAHPVDEPVGYELSGNMAVYRGDLKLTRNMAPVGDGQWHLYDIVKDPGETQDLQSSQPDEFQRMRADYDAYAQANGVLPMPEGYEPRNQVLINSLVNVYLPRARIPAAVALVVLVGLVVYRRRRNRVQP